MGIIDDLIFGNALTKLTNVFVEIEMTRAGAFIGAGGGFDSLPAGRRVAIGKKLPAWLSALRKRPPADVTRELLKNMHVVHRTGNDLRSRAQARLLETLVSEGIAQHPDEFLSGNSAFTPESKSVGHQSPGKEAGNQDEDFQVSPMMPDYFRRKPISGYLVDKVMVLFFEAPEPIANEGMAGDIPIKYLYAATAFDSASKRMTRIFTLETGLTPDVFFCAFERTGAHTNIGSGEGMKRLSSFENAVLGIVCKETGSASFKTLNVQS